MPPPTSSRKKPITCMQALFPKEVFPIDSIIPSIFVGSTTGIINNIMKALHPHQKNDHIIALLGSMEGTSDLWCSISDQVQKEENLFDDVLRISISQQDALTHEIQKQIGSKLGINYCSDETITGIHLRAQQLRAHLLSNIHQEDKKRLLVMIEKELDDAIDLEAVGFLRGDELDPKLLKIIVVSNKREVLNEMGVQQVIHIGNISFSDKYEMNCYRILDGYVAGSELMKLANECGSSDLAKRLAKKLKGQGLDGWANAFERLQESEYTYEARRKVIDSITSFPQSSTSRLAS